MDAGVVQDFVVHHAERDGGVAEDAPAEDAEFVDELGARFELAPVPAANSRHQRPGFAGTETRDVVQQMLLPRVRHRGVDVHAHLVDDVNEASVEDGEFVLVAEALLQRREGQRSRLAAGDERRHHRGRVAKVSTKRHGMAHLVGVLVELSTHRGAVGSEGGDGVVRKLHLDGIHLLGDGTGVILDDAADNHRNSLAKDAAVEARAGRRRHHAHVRAVFDHELEQPVEVRLLTRDGGAASSWSRSHSDVWALQKVDELAVGVEHGEGCGGISRAVHRGEDAHLHVIFRMVIPMILAHLRAPRRHGDAIPQLLAALQPDVHQRLTLHGDGRLARQRLDEELAHPLVERVPA